VPCKCSLVFLLSVIDRSLAIVDRDIGIASLVLKDGDKLYAGEFRYDIEKFGVIPDGVDEWCVPM
jgi:hypothetical protein